MEKTKITLEPMGYHMREAIKTLRTNILFCGNDKQVIVVTSGVMGEGKSTVSIRLAESLAELKKKVLLLDVDLRKSVMSSRLQTEGVSRGLTHFLSGQCTLSDVVVSTDIPRLHVVFSGPAAPNPTELLSGERFSKLIYSANFLYLGIGACALCFVTWGFAVGVLGPVKTSVYLYLTPVITLVCSAVILHEPMSPASLGGAALTLLGLILSQWDALRGKTT